MITHVHHEIMITHLQNGIMHLVLLPALHSLWRPLRVLNALHCLRLVVQFVLPAAYIPFVLSMKPVLHAFDVRS